VQLGRLGHFLHIEEKGKENQGVISSERRLGHFLHKEEKGKENQGGDKKRTNGGSLFAYRREWKREPGG